MSIGSPAGVAEEGTPFTILSLSKPIPFGFSLSVADDWHDGQLYSVSWQNTSQSIQKCIWQVVQAYREDIEVPLVVFAGAFSSSRSDGSGGKGV